MALLSDQHQRKILQLLADEGPFNDQTIAQRLGDRISTGDVFETTEHMSAQGWLGESEFAPGRWQITDPGRQEIDRTESDAAEVDFGADDSGAE